MANHELSIWQRFKHGPRHAQALTLLRVLTGLYFLYAGLLKYNNPHFGHLLGQTLQQWAISNPIAPYQWFLQHYAIPNASHFAQWVTDGELAVGFSYILGWLIPYSTGLAIFLNLNFLLASQHTNPALQGINLAFMAISFVLYWGQAGQYFGLDGLKGFQPSSAKASEEKKVTPFGKSNKKLEAITASLKKAKVDSDKAKAGKKNSKTHIKPF